MVTTLKYGATGALKLDLKADALVAECNAPRGKPIVDLPSAIASALDDPLEFPPLARSAVPGDRVAIVLDEAVPQVATLVAAVVERLVGAGVAATDITIVHTAADVAAATIDPRSQLPEPTRQEVALVVHDPDAREQLSYLAASTEAKPVYIHRAIHEADLIIPIGCLRLDDSLGYHGVSGGLFPAFSDTKSLERYRSPVSIESDVQRKRLRKEAEEVVWLMGVTFTVQVVPGANEDVLHVLAGALPAVCKRGKRLCREAWAYTVPHRASLVVASIAGDATQQTWQNLARAIAAASRAVAAEGVIAICSDLAEQPGPALQRIAGADDMQEAMREIIKVRPTDALPATQLVHATQRGPVYLLSRLDQDLVEQLGATPVTTDEQIARLASHHDSCIVLANAQYAVATPQEE